MSWIEVELIYRDRMQGWFCDRGLVLVILGRVNIVCVPPRTETRAEGH